MAGTARAVAGAVEESKKTDFLRVGVLPPDYSLAIPGRIALLKIIRGDNKHLRQIVVCEHNDGQMLLEVQRVVEGRVPVDFLGKIDGTTITPTEILAKIKEVY